MPEFPDLLYPLSFMRLVRKLPRLSYKELSKHEIPEPYNSLLVHQGDMTSRLEAFHESLLVVSALSISNDGKSYFREVFVERRWDDPLIFLSQDIDDNPNVFYYSISNYLPKNRPSLIMLTEKIIRKELQKRSLDQTSFGDLSDGIVPTYSMVYGKHIANIPADHIEGLCIGVFNFSSGCKAMKRSIASTLKNLEKIINKK